ncbi:MAG: aspartate aminotransferase family protein, partial [Chloroflexi bacterium]|nr:aspartate aminotransferase family protein [Chloroflexota bacterium]
MQYLYDETGRAYLDAVNNVPHVGHSHPRVVRAAQQQAALLNTNTRYLYAGLAEYLERLT